jgi:TatA/E family protein of Tat protein translocase
MPLQWWELLLILLVVLLVFGAKRLPEMGRSLGKGMREFKEAVSGDDRSHAPSRAELPSTPAEPTPSETEPDPAEKPERETVS